MDVDLPSQDGGVVEMVIDQSKSYSLIASQKLKSTSRISNYCMPGNVWSCYCKMFVDSYVPFNVANSAFFSIYKSGV